MKGKERMTRSLKDIIYSVQRQEERGVRNKFDGRGNPEALGNVDN